MKYLPQAIAALASVFLLSGCASTPTASGYLSDYNRLQSGQHIEKFWADTDRVQKNDSLSIRLGEISTAGISDEKGVSVAQCVSWLKAALLEGVVISEARQGAKLRIDLAITYMHPGSATARIIIGELGAGHAKVQIEGKVVDIESGAVLATFAERRRSSGSIGFRDLGGDSGPRLVEIMIQNIAKAVNDQMTSTFGSG